MTTPTTPPTEMPPAKKSRTTLYIAVAVIVIIIVAAVAVIYFSPSPFTPTKTIHLNGSATAGWNGTLNSFTITVKLTDKVRIVFLSVDSSLHNFVIAYSGSAPSSTPASGDLVSRDFSSSSAAYNFDFTPSKAGIFRFYCVYHFSAGMVGTIIIQ